MEQHNELRKLFDLPSMPKEVADSIGLEFDDFIDDVSLPIRKASRPKKLLKREQEGKLQPHKKRGIPFESGEGNPAKQRWRCLECFMESNMGGIVNHQNVSGHKGKQRCLPTMEKLGVIH